MRQPWRAQATLALGLVVAVVSALVGVSVLRPTVATAAATYPHDTSMGVRRAHHTASLLPDGRVLVAGGSTGNGTVDNTSPLATETAEIYDPSTDSWSPAAPMTAPRTKHTATVLNGPDCRDPEGGADRQQARQACGSVLVTGGYNDGAAPEVATSTFTTNLYRPAVASAPVGAWEPSGDMASTRAEHTATLLDGPECQVRAVDAPAHCGKVLIVGGFGIDRQSPAVPDASTPGRVEGRIEFYDPNTGLFTVAGTLATPRARHAATMLADGRVAIIGGVRGKGTVPVNPTNSLELYDPKIAYDTANPASNPVVTAPPMLLCTSTSQTVPCHQDRRPSATLLPDNTVLMLSGRVDGLEGNWSQIFDPTADSGKGSWVRVNLNSGAFKMDSHATLLLPTGRVLAGLINQFVNVVTDRTLPAYAYDVEEKVWDRYPFCASRCDVAQGGETMTLLRDSTVLVAGGAIYVDGSRSFGTIRSEAVRIDSVFQPGRPRGVTASSSGSGTRISWDPPSRDGGAPILRYAVREVSKASGNQTALKEVGGAAAGSATFEGTLVTHNYEVRAVNRVGPGLAGTPGTLNLPQAPTAVEAVAGNGAVSLRWTRPMEDVPPPTDGSAITGYEVRMSSTGLAPGAITVDGADVTTAEYTGLENGAQYIFQVVALSGNGPSRASPPSAPVTPGRILTAPAITSVASRDRSALVSWSPAVNPVGTIASYVVTATPGGATVRVPAAATVAVVPGLTNGTDYRLSVRGANAVGLGPESPLSGTVTPHLDSVANPPQLPTVAPAAVPDVISVASRGGPATGGPEVILTGVGFSAATSVRFGTAAAASFSVISDQQIAVTLPPRASGPTGRVTVVVTNPVGDSALDDGDAWFDYGTGGWTTTGSVPFADPGAPAVLPDGRVLTVAAAPSADTPPESAASVFGAASGLWTATDSAAADPDNLNRQVLTIGLANGDVLAFRTHDVFGRAVKAECLPDTGDTRTVCTDPNHPQIYRTGPGSSGQWSDVPTKRTAASGPAVLLEDDRVLVAGGCCQAGGASNAGVAAAEVFDPDLSGGTWVPVQPLPLPLVDHTLTVMRGTGTECGANCGKVLAAGGFKRRTSAPFVRFEEDNQMPLPPPAIFDPATNTWRTTVPMNAPRYGHGAVELPGGKVMVVGGSVHLQGRVDPGPSLAPPLATATTEVFDPASESWSYLAPMATRRSKPATLMLSDGRVLVAGGFSPTGPVADAEIYDPVKNEWSPAGALGSPGAAQLIELPTTGACGANCGRVLAIRKDGSVDTFLLPPVVASLSPASGPVTGGTTVAISGGYFTPESRVLFGGVPARSVSVSGPTSIVVTAPAGVLANSPVTVMTDGGATDAPQAFRYAGAPGSVSGLDARALSPNDIELKFKAAGSVGDAAPAAERYVVRQSRAPITEANFDAAPSLCGGICDNFVVNEVGEELRLAVAKLTAGTRYHYAVAALGAGDVMGPIATATTETLSVPSAVINSGPCEPIEAGQPGQVRYESGYSLLGLPTGTVSQATALFGWFNLGSGHRYSVENPGVGVAAGHGYWGWFACPTTVQLAAGTNEVRVPLGRYRASIVGNPATRSAELSGHDFAARWDPALNSGNGGYRISGYQETTPLQVGEGAWAFSYGDTSLVIRAR